MNPKHLNEALAQLCPRGRWTISGDDVTYDDVVWATDEYEMPAREAVEAAAAEVAARADANAHQAPRRMEYPPLAAFADAYYWSQRGDDSKMQAYLAAVEAVKLKYPKGA